MDDRQLIEDLLSALEYHTEQTRPIEFSKVAIEAAREYLRKPAQQEPVGYLSEGGAERLLTKKQAHEHIKNFRLFTHDVPLYTTPPQRNGLTEQQIKKILSDSKCWIGDDCSMPNLMYIVRLVEKAHGIGE